jgi:hypothetical protein
MFETQLTAAYNARSRIMGIVSQVVSQVAQFESDSAMEFDKRVNSRQTAYPLEPLVTSQSTVQTEMEQQLDAVTARLEALRLAVEPSNENI